MKYIKFTWLLIMPLVLFGGLMTGCNKEDESTSMGTPSIHYVRVTNPDAADSLLVGALLGNLVAIIGENLGTTKELYFNDRKAALDPTYITNRTILVNVPTMAHDEVTNKIRLVFRNGTELLYDFNVTIPPPLVNSMSNEYAGEGTVVVLNGDYFFEPISVTFNGGLTAEIQSMTQTQMEIVVPEGALPGPLTLTSNFGTSTSRLHYKDQRNIILNYDDLTADGSWRPGPIASENGIDGNYLRLFGTLAANQRSEDNFASQFWGHTRYDEKTNLFDGYAEDFVLKFEARVVQWYGSYLQITWGPWDNAGNQEYWSNLNGRGLWRPWEEEDKIYTTDDEWITVTIPLTEMIYKHEQREGNNVWLPELSFNKDIAGTLSFWVIATPKADNSPVEIHIDNVRIVEK